jgi:hypothetical protein
MGDQYGQHCSVADRELPKNGLQMHFNGILGQVELACNLLVPQSFDYQKHHFVLASGQSTQLCHSIAAWGARSWQASRQIGRRSLWFDQRGYVRHVGGDSEDAEEHKASHQPNHAKKEDVERQLFRGELCFDGRPRRMRLAGIGPQFTFTYARRHWNRLSAIGETRMPSVLERKDRGILGWSAGGWMGITPADGLVASYVGAIAEGKSA